MTTQDQNTNTEQHDAPTPDLQKLEKARRGRSIAIALCLAGLVLLFYVLTVVKMGPGLFDRIL